MVEFYRIPCTTRDTGEAKQIIRGDNTPILPDGFENPWASSGKFKVMENLLVTNGEVRTRRGGHIT